MRAAFQNFPLLGKLIEPRQGMATTDNKIFLRLWFEVPHQSIGICIDSRVAATESGQKWFPYNKGGSFRKWYGNNDFIVNYENDGEALKRLVKDKYKTKDYAKGFSDERWEKLIEIWVLKNQQFYFQPSVTWTFISSAHFGARFCPKGFIFDVAGSSIFPEPDQLSFYTGFMCSSVVSFLLKSLNPTLNFQVENIAALPVNAASAISVSKLALIAISVARADWDNFETSWDFRDQPLLRPGLKGATLEASWQNWEAQCSAAIRRMQELETENNRLFIAAYGLQDELSPEVPEAQITLARAEARRDMSAFLSYAVGCMMGRYSPDHPGLILANAGDTLEDYWRRVGSGKWQVASGKWQVTSSNTLPLTTDHWPLATSHSPLTTGH
jgi:hypothetical protein